MNKIAGFDDCVCLHLHSPQVKEEHHIDNPLHKAV